MVTEITFNGTRLLDEEKEWDYIKKDVYSSYSFSGSIESGNLIFLFNSVKPIMFDYYYNEFKKLKQDNNNKEVKFEIQTNASFAKKVQ
tara:strand:- start:820 stop:1083 length:264 start_codon:yes stop_codon:yes gene_type:complete